MHTTTKAFSPYTGLATWIKHRHCVMSKTKFLERPFRSREPQNLISKKIHKTTNICNQQTAPTLARVKVYGHRQNSDIKFLKRKDHFQFRKLLSDKFLFLFSVFHVDKITNLTDQTSSKYRHTIYCDIHQCIYYINQEWFKTFTHRYKGKELKC